MDETTDAGHRTPARASPWPVFVALGLTLSEVGVVFNRVSVALVGILLFSASVVGVVRDAGSASSRWAPTAVVGSLFAAGGAALLGWTSFAFRGTYIGAAGATLLVAAAAFYLVDTGRL